MANHFNKIQVARGNIKSKTTPLLGELFYDYNTKSVYIGAQNEAGGEAAVWKRFGGFDSIVIKGTLGNADFKTFEFSTLNLLPGDAYIVTAPIRVEQKEIIFNGNGTVTRGENYRLYNDFFKPGQIIVYCAEDLTNLPNSAVIDNNTGFGFIALSGGENASDIEYDPSTAQIASETQDPLGGEGGRLNDVQSAIDYLFNNKIEFVGETGDVTITADDFNQVHSGARVGEEVYVVIADKLNLLPGQFIIYNGDTKTVEFNGHQFVIKKNTAIIKVADVVGGPAEADGMFIQPRVLTFPLGSSDSNDIDFHFADERKSSEAIGDVHTVDKAGSAVTIDNDEDVSSVTQALDVLHQTKADLNAQGKIPLSQIPNTFIGALQYIGTLTLVDTSHGNGTELSAVEFARAMEGLNGVDSMEKPLEGDAADVAFSRLDAGDYVIINVADGMPWDGIGEGEASGIKNNIKVITGPGENDFFRVSTGDHVICNSVTYDDLGNITDVKLDHLDTAGNVDNVNGIGYYVNIKNHFRVVNASLSSEAIPPYTLRETEVLTNPVTHEITIGAPNAVLAPNNLTKNVIPVGNGDMALISSEVTINGQGNASKWHDADHSEHNTELVGKKSNGNDVVVEFPDKNGKLLVSGDGQGTKDRLSKFDADGNLIDSDVEQSSEDKTLTVLDDEGNSLITLNYGDLAKLLQFTSGITRRFDEEVEVEVEGDEFLRKFTELRNYDEKTHTILDDCSTIDGGEWV